MKAKLKRAGIVLTIFLISLFSMISITSIGDNTPTTYAELDIGDVSELCYELSKDINTGIPNTKKWADCVRTIMGWN